MSQMLDRIPNEYQIAFRQSTAASTKATYRETIDINVNIDAVTIQFPPGTAGLVEVEIFVNNHRIFPFKGDAIALDSWTQRFPLEYPLREKDKLQVVINNGDAVNPHTIPVIFDVIRRFDEQ